MPYLLRGDPVETGVRSWLCMTMMSQKPPEDVNTKLRRPVRTGIEAPSEESAPVISQRTSTTATSGFRNRIRFTSAV